jgi:hypothetical protein
LRAPVSNLNWKSVFCAKRYGKFFLRLFFCCNDDRAVTCDMLLLHESKGTARRRVSPLREGARDIAVMRVHT